MIWFSGEQILFSILYSLIYGGIFALFVCFLSVLSTMIKNGAYMLACFFIPGRKLTASDLRVFEKEEKSGFIIYLYIILFTLGFILLSYIALDGCIRAYTLLFSLISFYLIRLILKNSFSIFVLAIYNHLLSVAYKLFCCITYPFVVIVAYIYKRLVKVFLKRKNFQVKE